MGGVLLQKKYPASHVSFRFFFSGKCSCEPPTQSTTICRFLRLQRLKFRKKKKTLSDLSKDPTNMPITSPNIENSYCWWKKSCTMLIGSSSHYFQFFLHLRWCRISSISSITSICLKWLEKLKKSSPKSWFNSNLPWYKITNHLKQISSIITMNFQFSLSSRRASRNSNPFLRQTYRWVSSRWFQPIWNLFVKIDHLLK